METVKARVRSFFWEDNQWRLRLYIPGFGCYRAIGRYIIQAFSVNVDSRCTVTKGSYTIDRFDYNALHQVWEPETEYGRWTWIFEITSRGRTLFCLAVESVSVPRKFKQKQSPTKIRRNLL
ncbi:uncharacterized protein LOC114361461 [Ostrinia furnacalis]|uniref:uncharacterized protein LOC114361461 n=1 Tax=Ostrinia furnacalis TaxID=93504 RepID=UPI00103FD1EE|nr:uncharacterized protein LOC114361461 [Ostrinia furnacalis]